MLVLLLIGGDKSTQRRDIRLAHALAADWQADRSTEEGHNEHD